MPESQAVTIVISRDGRGAADGSAAFENALAEILTREYGADVLLAPHLYHLRAAHPAAAALISAGDLAVASWLHPRAAFWTLRALGVGARAIRCVNLGDFASAADCARALAPEPARNRPGAVKQIAEPASPRWYPVIDYSRCTGCRKCADFCLFGVYALAGGNIVVSNPDNCKPGCPACARTCPQRAIIFPDYFADAVIAGADMEDLAKVRSNLGKVAEASRAPARPPQPERRRDDLDDLITSLEKLDE